MDNVDPSLRPSIQTNQNIPSLQKEEKKEADSPILADLKKSMFIENSWEDLTHKKITVEKNSEYKNKLERILFSTLENQKNKIHPRQ